MKEYELREVGKKTRDVSNQVVKSKYEVFAGGQGNSDRPIVEGLGESVLEHVILPGRHHRVEHAMEFNP